MKKVHSIIAIIGVSALLFSFSYKTLNNINLGRDNFKQLSLAENENSTELVEIKIGTQIWSATNLNVSTFKNGDTIFEAKTDKEWRKARKEEKPAYCYYTKYGISGEIFYHKLYNWYAVNDPRGLAPDEWHVPSDEEWKVLTDFLGGENIAGGKLKEATTVYWSKPNTGATNEAGFSALPGGYCNFDGLFGGAGIGGYWWTSTEHDKTHAWCRAMYNDKPEVSRFWSMAHKSSGFSVRCIKN